MTKELFKTSIATLAANPATPDERVITVDGQANVEHNRGLQDILDQAGNVSDWAEDVQY